MALARPVFRAAVGVWPDLAPELPLVYFEGRRGARSPPAVFRRDRQIVNALRVAWIHYVGEGAAECLARADTHGLRVSLRASRRMFKRVGDGHRTCPRRVVSYRAGDGDGVSDSGPIWVYAVRRGRHAHRKLRVLASDGRRRLGDGYREEQRDLNCKVCGR